MILYGRDFSPFTRRVAIWCDLQGRTLERRQIAVAGAHAEEIRAVNPMGRVPVLISESGDVMIETFAIIDYLEHRAPERERLIPSGSARQKVMQQIARAHAVTEIALTLYYEMFRTEAPSDKKIEKLTAQVHAGLEMILPDNTPESWIGGTDGPTGADVATVCAFDFVRIAVPNIVAGQFAALQQYCDWANRVPAFGKTRPEK